MTMATMLTTVGYISAVLTFFRSRSVFSRYVASRARISDNKPPFSPAPTMATYSRLNDLGCRISASEKLSPASTREQTSLTVSRMTLLVVCSASACSDWTMAMPASIMVASCRVNTTKSASCTRRPGLSAFGHLLPDFHHQQIAVKQRGDGGLFGGGFDGIANFPARGRSRAV